jgi:hypothetical protein
VGNVTITKGTEVEHISAMLSIDHSLYSPRIVIEGKDRLRETLTQTIVSRRKFFGYHFSDIDFTEYSLETPIEYYAPFISKPIERAEL